MLWRAGLGSRWVPRPEGDGAPCGAGGGRGCPWGHKADLSERPTGVGPGRRGPLGRPATRDLSTVAEPEDLVSLGPAWWQPRRSWRLSLLWISGSGCPSGTWPVFPGGPCGADLHCPAYPGSSFIFQMAVQTSTTGTYTFQEEEEEAPVIEYHQEQEEALALALPRRTQRGSYGRSRRRSQERVCVDDFSQLSRCLCALPWAPQTPPGRQTPLADAVLQFLPRGRSHGRRGPGSGPLVLPPGCGWRPLGSL